MEPIISGLITEIFKKIVSIFGDSLSDIIFKRKNKRRDTLLSLFTNLKSLEKGIGDIISVLEILITDPNQIHNADSLISKALQNVRSSMTSISNDLDKIAPEFEIMAEETVPLLDSYLADEELFISQLGLTRQRDNKEPDFKESLQRYRERLVEIKSQGSAVKKSLSEFIRKCYTWEQLS